MKNKGIIPINKPQGWTSFDVCNKLKYRLKPLKVGHLGTLDPMATGVLLVTVGKATKLFDLMQEKQKTYVATFKFGVLTDTLDSTGVEIKNLDIPTISREQLENATKKFIGKISQIPPKFSAKSINGKRAYDLARNGVDFELKPKEVIIYSINLLEFDGTNFKLEITCGSGTYIRSVGRDLASELNTVATMTSLTRTKVGNISVEQCFDIDLIEDVQQHIIPIKDILNYETLTLDEMLKSKILNGQTIEVCTSNGIYLLLNDKDVVALVEVKENKAKMSLFLG